MIKFGAHLTARRFPEIWELPDVLGYDVVQFFLHTPYKYFIDRSFNLTPEVCMEFKERKKGRVAVVHTCFMINMASPDNRIWNVSNKSIVEDMKIAEQLGVDYVVTHVGSHTEASTMEHGIRRVVSGIKYILTKTQKIGLLLEDAAGHGTAVGNDFENLKRILAEVNSPRLGVCLDIAHAYAWGYDFSKKEVVDDFHSKYSSMIKLIHFNSPGKDVAGKEVTLGSGRDRHRSAIVDSVLKGEEMKYIAQKFSNVPLVMERPVDEKESGVAGDVLEKDTALIKSWSL